MNKDDLKDHQKPEKRHRPNQKYNWESLQKEWMQTDLTKAQFLQGKNINNSSGTVHRNTSHWDKDIDRAKKTLEEAQKEEGITRQERIHNIWQLVQAWRKGLSKQHYQRASKISMLVDKLIEQACEYDNQGNLLKISMKPSELRAIIGIEADIQKIQRLALGMTSDNVGAIDPETHVDKSKEDKEKKGPIFVVEVNKNGKFVRSRPREITS